MISNSIPRSLIFCTAFSPDVTHACEHWNSRYQIWVKGIQASQLDYELSLIIDDGSDQTPSWDNVQIIENTSDIQPTARTAIYKFDSHLGRIAILDYPGWYRSFMFAAEFAVKHGFAKIIHIESDAVVLSSNLTKFINDYQEGWASLWCPRHKFPETCIQIIAGTGLEAFREFAKSGYEAYRGKLIEDVLPFTEVVSRFEGDRYGEYLDHVPRTADYAAQLLPHSAVTDYHWWLPHKDDPMA